MQFSSIHSAFGSILQSNKFQQFKPKSFQVLKNKNYNAHIGSFTWYQGMTNVSRNFRKNVLSEFCFRSNGTVSSQNYRWWADSKQHFGINIIKIQS